MKTNHHYVSSAFRKDFTWWCSFSCRTGDLSVVRLREQPLWEAEGDPGGQRYPWQRAQREGQSLCLRRGDREGEDVGGDVSMCCENKWSVGVDPWVKITAFVLRCWELNQICQQEPLTTSRLMPPTGRGPNYIRWEEWRDLRQSVLVHLCLIRRISVQVSSE